MRFLTYSALLAAIGLGAFARPQEAAAPKSAKGAGSAKSGGASSAKSGSGPTGLGAILGPGARPGSGCAKLEVLIGQSALEAFGGFIKESPR
jgi:hypothetical protein